MPLTYIINDILKYGIIDDNGVGMVKLSILDKAWFGEHSVITYMICW